MMIVQRGILGMLVFRWYDIEVENTDNVDDLIDAIIRANDNLKDSSQNGDWTMMGKDMDKLQTLIEQLNKLVEEQKNKESTVVIVRSFF